MPSTGKPSRDCYRCRQRRIKCDLGQPECQKCLRLGQPCPGYRNDSGLIFQNESQESFAESASRDRRKANVGSGLVLPSRTMPTIMSRIEVNDIAARIALFDKLIYRHGPPPPNLSESWDDHALPFVISQFSAPMTNGERFYGFMDFFPEMIAKATESSPLILCCKAVGLMYFNNKYVTTAEATNRRVAAYGKALSATNAVLSDQDAYLGDEIFVSIWLLSVYEVLCGPDMSLDCPGRPLTWNMHILGLTSLVRMKTRPEFLSGSGRRFFWMVMGLVQARSLAAGVECPKEIFTWLEEHMADFVPEELDMHHSLVHGYHASVLCANIRKIIAAEELQDPQSITAILEEARKIGRDPEASLAQHSLTKFLHLRQAHIHNFHRTVRMHVQYSILELLQSSAAKNDAELTPQFLEKQQRTSITAIQTLAQDTLATIPYVLGPKWSTSTTSKTEEEPERPRCWADGLRFLWPLRVIGSRRVITKEQRAVAEEAMQRLNDELCIRAAVIPYAIPKQMQLGKLAQVKVSRRNKACKTCRRRKVKCDEERPFCQRCRASQLDCEAYESSPVDNELVESPNSDQGYIARVEEPMYTLNPA